MNRPPWRHIPLIAVVVVAFGCGGSVLAYSLDFWQPCYANGFDSLVCLRLQSDGDPDPSYGRLYIPWLVTTSASIVTWVLAAVVRDREGVVVAATASLVVLFAGNPFADYVLTPLLNGGYMSHDDHPGLGIPVAVAQLASGLIALVGVLRRQPADPSRNLNSV